jgi:hypothetical protein
MINWKNLFSLRKRKAVQKKLLKHLSQPDSPLDAEQVKGGAQPDNDSTFAWRRSEAAADPK